MNLTLIILCFLIAGCACSQVQAEDLKHRAVIYDDKGKVKEHVVIQDGYITIYDKDWKTTGYGTVKP